MIKGIEQEQQLAGSRLKYHQSAGVAPLFLFALGGGVSCGRVGVGFYQMC